MLISLETNLITPVTDKETTRFSACLLFSANALARAITTAGDKEFSRIGLTYSHAYLLLVVVESPGVTPMVLSEQLFLSPSTITRLLDKLEQKQFVTRQSEGKNTRVRPTEAGLAVHPFIVEAVERNTRHHIDMLGGNADDLVALTKQIFGAATAFGDQ
jgi:MarR family transcriptional regulator, organic hydroperoxide resistance regulator